MRILDSKVSSWRLWIITRNPEWALKCDTIRGQRTYLNQLSTILNQYEPLAIRSVLRMQPVKLGMESLPGGEGCQREGISIRHDDCLCWRFPGSDLDDK